jgi:hypothetical protein
VGQRPTHQQDTTNTELAIGHVLEFPSLAGCGLGRESKASGHSQSPSGPKLRANLAEGEGSLA